MSTTSTPTPSGALRPALLPSNGLPATTPAPVPPPTVMVDDEVERLKSLIAQQGTGTKRSHSDRKSSETPGRTLRRCVALFDPLSSLVTEANLRHSCPNRTFADANEKRDADRLYMGYKILLSQAKGVKEIVMDKAVTWDNLMKYFRQLEAAANRARSDDNGRIRDLIPRWLIMLSPFDVIRLDSASREGRGLDHDYIGRLITPTTHDWDNPEVRAAIRNGEASISENYFVRCFYEDLKGDPTNVDNGFLMSVLLVLAWCAVFSSPSSTKYITDLYKSQYDENSTPAACKRRKTNSGRATNTKPNVATIIGLTEATPRSIAYIAVLVHFNLTDASRWQEEYYGLSYAGLFNFIVDYFEAPANDDDKERAAALLKWWNKRVFPHAGTSTDAKASADNSMALLQKSREDARRMKEAEAAVAASAIAADAEAAEMAAVAAAAAEMAAAAAAP